MLSKPLEALSAGSRSVKSISLGRLSSAKKIANGVVIFGARQAMQVGQIAGIGFERTRPGRVRSSR